MSMDFDVVDGRVVEKRVAPKVTFYTHPVLDREESERIGERVYRDAIYIQVQARGCKDCISRKAKPDDFKRFEKEYALFLSAQDKDPGTDVELIVKTPSHLASLKARGIATVEQLAAVDVLPEELRAYKVKAKAFMELTSNEQTGKNEDTQSEAAR